MNQCAFENMVSWRFLLTFYWTTAQKQMFCIALGTQLNHIILVKLHKCVAKLGSTRSLFAAKMFYWKAIAGNSTFK